ncbi:type II toxin-antitoxin system HicB family antitoxin [bacterium]|nr:type II toxin-antitoxin system HicB family antitoxin [bacterium]
MTRFTAIFEKRNDLWIGYIEELPGANTQGRTIEETRENLKEAVQLIIETNREIAQKQMDKNNIVREYLVVHI